MQGEKKARHGGGLNPYQRRHGGDKTNYSKSLGALQHDALERRFYVTKG
ncbi:hypothetical protein BCAR13_1040035 [Paraburkholderia caribensis]|jgi:hypothetical protein|nr:hypothetical protein BCAR13_1040035 [Paraburkholderia caribensis]